MADKRHLFFMARHMGLFDPKVEVKYDPQMVKRLPAGVAAGVKRPAGSGYDKSLGLAPGRREVVASVLVYGAVAGSELIRR